MIIPLRTDREFRRRPVVTESLLVLNLLVYLVMAAGAFLRWFEVEQFIDAGSFKPFDFTAWQLITYQFLHDPGGPWHLAFNMLFLWIFGGAVEDRLGRLGFAGFYLIGGAVAALAHWQVSMSPVIGASGSIAAVTGAYLALFPRSTIKVLVIFFVIGIFHIPALWFIGFFFLVDVLRQTGDLLGASGSNVAYMAHIAGYLYGFALAFVLLAMKLVRHDDYDVFYLFTQSRRRAAFRAASKSSPSGMWDSAQSDAAKRLEKRRKTRTISEAEQREAEQRAAISRLIAAHDLPGAAARYRDLLAGNSGAVLSEAHQLDVANQLYSEGHHETAARAYELLLERYPGSSSASEVRLILGIIYARRLDKPTQARQLIEEAHARLSGAQQELANQLLAELGPA